MYGREAAFRLDLRTERAPKKGETGHSILPEANGREARDYSKEFCRHGLLSRPR